MKPMPTSPCKSLVFEQAPDGVYMIRRGSYPLVKFSPNGELKELHENIHDHPNLMILAGQASLWLREKYRSDLNKEDLLKRVLAHEKLIDLLVEERLDLDDKIIQYKRELEVLEDSLKSLEEEDEG